MEEGGEGNWMMTPDLRRKGGLQAPEFLCFLPRVGPEAPEAHMRPGMERRDSCGMCGVYGGNRDSEPPVPAEHTRVTSWKPVRHLFRLCGFEDKSHRL